MTEVFPYISLIVRIAVLILLTIAVKRMAHEIDELKEKLEHHRIKFNQLEFDYSSISDHEKRLDQLEEVLELKEYFDEEPLNEETL